MFPTSVGMNRYHNDPPVVFPTSVGMNHDEEKAAPGGARVPHERGDEPLARRHPPLVEECSPRAWG